MSGGASLQTGNWSAIGAADYESGINRAGELAPYLGRLCQEHGEWLDKQSTQKPKDVWQELCLKAKTCAKLDDLNKIMAELRKLKRQAHLYCAMTDLSRIWDWAAATKALTEFADCALHAAFQFSARQADIIGTPVEIAPGIFALALGKYGAGELNYSSDIDFIIFYDPERVKLPQGKTAERQIIKFVQKLVKILGEINGEGYVFRTDLRLRPDPRSTSVAVSTRSAERYYEALGQNWERAAMIKARVCAGDSATGQDFIDDVLTPFIWRRSLDFAAIDDIQAMARQIQAKGKRAEIKSAGHNLKLGRGGIRAIEFYVQTQQLILGGRHEELRTLRTVDTLKELADAKFIESSTAQFLGEDYALLRDLEHRVQMLHDEQTHDLPQSDEARLAVAQLSGYSDLAGFDLDIMARLSRVHAEYSALYSGTETLATPEGSLMFTGVSPEAETLETLRSMGFTRAEDIWSSMAGWLGGRIMATRHERARELLTALAPHILMACRDSGDPDGAFFRFSEFFTQLRSGVSLLSYFRAQPDVVQFLMQLLAISPYLAETLSRKPEILDAVIEPDFVSRPLGGIGEGYDASDLGDAESVMDHVRRRVREDRFRIGSGLLQENLSSSQAALAFTNIADNGIKTLCRPALDAALKRSRSDAKFDYAILALGKMGSRELSAQSDLDIMVIYGPKSDDSYGAHEQATTFTKRLINYLSATTSEGGLFEVDMALRPSGGSGPITVSLEALEKYYANEAWSWEFMALSRARIVHSSNESFADDLASLLNTILEGGANRLDIIEDARSMRARLLRDKTSRGLWDIKRNRGGLVDAEFILQVKRLTHAELSDMPLGLTTVEVVEYIRKAKAISDKEAAILASALEFYHNLRLVLGLSWEGLFDITEAPQPLIDRLCRATLSANEKAMAKALAKHQKAIAKLFDQTIGKPEKV